MVAASNSSTASAARISAWWCRSRVRRRRLPLSAGACLAFGLVGALGLLGACATTGGGGSGRVDWPAYGAALRAEAPAERLRLHAEARNAHQAAPTAETAIRLALLSASLDAADRDLDSALGLLDYAAANLAGGDTARLSASAETSRVFLEFYRPLLIELRDQQAALAAEADARQGLERQLDALRELEERLNADDAER